MPVSKSPGGSPHGGSGVTPEQTKDSRIRRRVLVGTASNYAGQFVAFGTLFFLTPFILHQLGNTVYGLWVLIGSVVAYGSLLDFGIWGAIIKYVAEHRARGEDEQARALVATAVCLYAFLGLIIFLLSVILAPFLLVLFNIPADQHSTAIRLAQLMGLGIGISLPGMAPMAVLRGLQRYDIVNLVDIVATLFTALATVAVLLLGGGVLGLVIVNITGIFVVLALGSWFIRRIAPELEFGWRRADLSLMRTVLAYSWPLFVKDAASRLQTKTDEITIGAFLPVMAIAPYNLARKLSETTHILTKQFMKVLLPLASELHAENDLERLRSLFMTGTRLTLAISLAIGGILILLAQPVLTLWVGAEYASAAYLVAILTVASLIATTQWPAGAVLQGMARHQVLAATSLGSGIANLALSIALVGPFGLTGVALGTLVPNAVEFAIIMPYALKVIQVRMADVIREVLLPAFSPAILMVLVLLAVRQLTEPTSLLSTVIASGAGLGVFATSYLSLGANKVERQTCQRIVFSMVRFAVEPFKR